MVTRSRRGSSTLGCLVSLALFVAALYYGVNIGEVYIKYYQLLDEMQSQARLAPSLSDAVIQRRILDKVDELGLPDEAQNVSVTRSSRPARIVIETNYSETLHLPLITPTFHLHPRAEEGL
ncbi:MAG TPA: hypothetical protein VFI41_03615 [Gemmatimonadales bacterium]|jgi:hypothetical protein|nr:hypothetical protein [Gemmatimonadales bacterium]